MAKESSKSGARHRRRGAEVVRAATRRRHAGRLGFLQSRHFAWAVLITLGFVLVATVIADRSLRRPLVAVGRVADQTRLARVRLSIEDQAASASAREEARLRTPRVYQAQEAVLGEIRSSLENLPRTLAGRSELGEIEEGIVKEFGLDEARLQAIRAMTIEGEPSQEWLARVDALMSLLERMPMLDDRTWQRESQEGLRGEKFLELRLGEASELVSFRAAVNLANAEQLARDVASRAQQAQFSGPLQGVIVSRLTQADRPTYRFDMPATLSAQRRVQGSIRPVMRDVPVGEIIVRRGEVVTSAQVELLAAEARAARTQRGAWMVWPKRFGVLGAVAAITVAMGGYLAMFCPRVRRSPPRMAWIAGLMAGGLLIACIGMLADARLAPLATLAPTVFVAVILAIAYDQRTALTLAALHGLLVCVALDRPISTYALMIAGAAAAVVMIPAIRSRSTLIRMGLGTAGVLTLGTLVMGVIDRPASPELLGELTIDAALAGFGGLLVAGLTMFILPTIERAFDITTGLTLVELRDPKQPLLRELQQRAPGTYNHSLNVASIAEAAADAIGADSLLTYVGSLYHDIGKMNKPEYFVENQAGGRNKHDKLNPAMSLLVIVGHVKDGVEMAREAGLPRCLIHFIEAHHGTTLVEFFYRRAQKQAAENGASEGIELPDEFEYRYPGPRPQTREVAIIMLADSVESATRTLSDPTPARIDALVRELANKRLLDGQYDECALTLRELSAIVESISKTVASIYHGRIAYPAGEAKTDKATKAAAG